MPHSSVTHRGDRKGPPLPGIIVNTGVIRRGTPLRLPSGCPFPRYPAVPSPFVRSMPRRPPPGRPQGSALPGIIVNGDVIRRGTPLRLPSGCPFPRYPAVPSPFVRSMPRRPPPGRPQGSALPGIIVNGDVIRRGTPLRLPSGRPLCRRAIPVCVIDVVASTTGATARVRPYENHDVYRRMSSR